MIRDLMTGGASVEDTLTLWASSLRDVKQRIRPLFTQERVAAPRFVVSPESRNVCRERAQDSQYEDHATRRAIGLAGRVRRRSFWPRKS